MARLMCSKDREEVELVKKHLFKAGISSEIRHNPLAAALRVSRVELWVQDESDFFKASKLYAGMQARGAVQAVVEAPERELAEPAPFIELEDSDALAEKQGKRREDGTDSKQKDLPHKELVEASSNLEKEIEQMLERQNDLETTSKSLWNENKDLANSLANTKAALARETETRVTVEKKQAIELSGLQAALDRERSERASAEEQLKNSKREYCEELKARDEALREVRKNLDAKSHQLQVQQEMVVELKKEIAERESKCHEQENSLYKARADASAEREMRMAAEERAEKEESARKVLAAQLMEQKRLREDVSASVQRLNSLRSKLEAKRTTASQS